MNDDNAMELSDLKAAWTSLEDRIDTNFKRVEALATELAADKTRSLARRAMLPPIIDAVVQGLVLAVVIAGFSYPGSATYVGCLVGTVAILALLIAAAIAQIVMLANLDPAAPVITVQRQLGRVSAFRIFEWQWVLLLSPLLWTPFFVVAIELPLKSLAASNAASVNVFSAGYVWASLAIGAAMSLGLLWLSRWFARKFAGSEFLRGFMNDLAGRRLSAARDFLQRLDGFERA